jgi:hypothetical protein
VLQHVREGGDCKVGWTKVNVKEGTVRLGENEETKRVQE